MEVRLYATLRAATDGGRVDLAAGFETIGEVLDELVVRFPDLGRLLFVAEHDIRPMVAVMVDGRDIRHLAGLDTEVDERSTIDIFPPVAGGGEAQADAHEVERTVNLRGLPEWLVRDYLVSLGAREPAEPETRRMAGDRWRVAWTPALARVPGSALVLTEFALVFAGDEQVVARVEREFLQKAQRGGG